MNELETATVEKPWGAYTVLQDGETHKVKHIEVLPGHRLSNQRHARRSEHWFVVGGVAIVELDGVEHRLEPGQAIDIPVGTAHRVTNREDVQLDFIEVQTGDYFGEDDIERLDDDYGRADA